MKEYRLTGWPDLHSNFERTPYRRMLCDMSQRFVSTQRLATVSGLGRGEVARFLSLLSERGLLVTRDAVPVPSILKSLRSFEWLRRAVAPARASR